jgi:hypothetical protein
VPVFDFEIQKIRHCSRKVINGSRQFDVTKENIDKMMNYKLFDFEKYCEKCLDIIPKRPPAQRNRIIEILKEEEPGEIEMKEVKVDLKKEMIFTIPMNTKDPAEVKQSIKGLIEYIRDKLKLTVDKIHGVKDGPSLREAYEVLDDWYRERHIKRIREEGLGVEPKKPRINMMRYKGSKSKGSGYKGKGSKGSDQKGSESKGSESNDSESKGSKSKGSGSKGSKWKELEPEGSLLDEYGDELRSQDRIVERGYILGAAGSLAKSTRDQELWDLNEEKAYIYHKQLTLRYKGPSREKDKLYEEEIDQLKRTSRIYENYGEEERRIRERAVDALRIFEEQIFWKSERHTCTSVQ